MLENISTTMAWFHVCHLLFSTLDLFFLRLFLASKHNKELQLHQKKDLEVHQMLLFFNVIDTERKLQRNGHYS